METETLYKQKGTGKKTEGKAYKSAEALENKSYRRGCGEALEQLFGSKG